MAGNTYCVTIAQSVASSTAVNTSTTETIIIPDLTLAANYLTQGKRLRLTAWGKLSSLTATTPNLTLRVRIGTTTLSATYATASGALAFTATAITDGTFRLEVDLVCQTTGSSGTGLVFGQAYLPNLTAATTVGGEGYNNTLPVTSPAAGTINTTVANLVSVSGQWSASSGSNSIQVMFYTWEELN
jgi:hypothetical protein